MDTVDRTATHRLLLEHPEECACRTLTGPQAAVLAVAAVAVAGLLAVSPRQTMVGVNLTLIVFYIAFSLYKLALINLSIVRKREEKVTTGELAVLADADLPSYTILVPLYRETEVLPQVVSSLGALDYPREKMEVLLLCEEDDGETLAAARRLSPGPPFRVVVVPRSLPRTKPKACNLGLAEARGELLVIYDAEDMPETDQLKKAAAVFRRVPGDVVCLQAKLNFYNQRQNLIARWFTTEYSMWFDLYLPGLGAIDAPIPLGGTSNHFRTAILRELGGWDPYNVTEDCDLGIRLHIRGRRTRVLDSTTWEEACASPGYWMRQRSRWVKGYIQTYLVHMRRPVFLARRLGGKDFLNFQMIVGGMFFCFLLNPFYWVFTLLWFLTRWQAFSFLFPSFVFLLGSLCLFLGNFVFIYSCAIGVHERGYHDLVKYALVIPPYWLFISVAAWKGFLQLFVRPFHWEKTRHGLAAPGRPR